MAAAQLAVGDVDLDEQELQAVHQRERPLRRREPRRDAHGVRGHATQTLHVLRDVARGPGALGALVRAQVRAASQPRLQAAAVEQGRLRVQRQDAARLHPGGRPTVSQIHLRPRRRDLLDVHVPRLHLRPVRDDTLSLPDLQTIGRRPSSWSTATTPATSSSSTSRSTSWPTRARARSTCDSLTFSGKPLEVAGSIERRTISSSRRPVLRAHQPGRAAAHAAARRQLDRQARHAGAPRQQRQRLQLVLGLALDAVLRTTG